MSDTSDSGGDKERRLDEAVAEYLQMLAVGEVPDRAAWLEQHADVAEELDGLLSNYDTLNHLEEIKNQNEIAQLDRQWALERENYLVSNQHGTTQSIPSKLESVVAGIPFVVFAMIFIAFTFTISTAFPFPLKFLLFLLPVFGVLSIVVVAIGYIRLFIKADHYSKAEASYQRRRQELTGKK